MTTNRVLALTAFDGSVYHVPLAVIAASWREHYKDETEKPDDDELIAWAENNMNWSDVSAQARQVKKPDPLDMDDAWVDGKMQIVDAPTPAVPDPVADPAVQAATLARPMPNKTLGKLLSNAGLVRGIETSIVLGHDDDHLSVIQAIAADGLKVEKTQERRLVLEAIRQACARTIALQQPAQVAQ